VTLSTAPKRKPILITVALEEGAGIRPCPVQRNAAGGLGVSPNSPFFFPQEWGTQGG